MIQKPSFLIPKSATPMNAPEHFDKITLSDKINGKAELYLSANFKSLWSQRFQMTDAPEAWFEMFIYDMENLRNAFAVYSGQKRENSTPDSTTRFSYFADNAMYFVHGGFYVEMIGSETTDELSNVIKEVAKNFVQSVPINNEKMPELAKFPKAGLITDSITLNASDAFGFEDFKFVFTGQYNMSGTRVTAFISKNGSPAEAMDLANAYQQFLINFGGRLLNPQIAIPNAAWVEIFSAYEVLFTCNEYILGIHEASNLKAAEVVAERLYENCNTP
jgi:hypothetical protein